MNANCIPAATSIPFWIVILCLLISLVGIADHDGRGRGFDDVGEVCVGKPPPQRVHRRRGEDDVANLAETDEQDPRDVIRKIG